MLILKMSRISNHLLYDVRFDTFYLKLAVKYFRQIRLSYCGKTPYVRHFYPLAFGQT